MGMWRRDGEELVEFGMFSLSFYELGIPVLLCFIIESSSQNLKAEQTSWTLGVLLVLLQEMKLLCSGCPVLCVLGGSLSGRVSVGLATDTRQALNSGV